MIEAPDMDAMRQDLHGVSIDDDATRATIVKAYREHGVVLEPHGAVGWAGLEHSSPRTRAPRHRRYLAGTGTRPSSPRKCAP